MRNPRLVSLSGYEPETLGDFGIGEAIGAIITIISVATTTIVSGVQNKRARDQAAELRKTAMQVQANQELAAMDAALQQRNQTVEAGYQKLLTKAVSTSNIKKYLPVALIGGALVAGSVAMKKSGE